MLANGSHQELQTSGLDFTEFLGTPAEKAILPGSDDEIDELADDEISEKSVRNRKGSDTTSVSSMAGEKNVVVVKPEDVPVAETHFNGKVGYKIYWSYIMAGGHYCKIIGLLLVCVLAQVVGSGGDYWISRW